MKHFTIYTLSVLLVLAACEREAIPVNERETPGEGERITLRFEAPVTRSEIDGTTGAMTWTSGDQIAVCCTDGATKRYETVTVNTSASTAEITMGASDSRCDYAVFPASAVPASPTAAQFTAPAVVFPTTYDIRGKNAETYSPCPMVAVNSGSTLDFYHVGALVRIQLTDVPEGTAAIRVTFTGMTHVTGTYNVSGAGTAGATLSLASGTGNAVTVTIDADDEYVNIPIPQGSYAALTKLKVEALDSSLEKISSVENEVTWSTFTRGRGRNSMAVLTNYARKYLTFDIIDGGTIIWQLSTTSSSSKTISYRKNAGEWTSITSSTSGISITVSAGDKLEFKGDNLRYGSGSSSSSAYNFFSGTAKFSVSGNIASLVKSDNFINFSPSSNTHTNGFFRLFYNSLVVNANNLIIPFTDQFSCKQMFYNCGLLLSAPKLYDTTLASDCYRGMFEGCTSLTTAPELPATTLSSYCYYQMFYGCTSLTTAPELPAITLVYDCYYQMFEGCTSLTTAPELPATTLTSDCYNGMFYGCTSLTTAPELPATTLAGSCYSNMFYGCTSLTTAPELPATTLVNYCYYQMFFRCTSLNYVKAMFITTPDSNNCGYWLSSVKSTGTFVKNSAATWNVTGVHGVPTGWTIHTTSSTGANYIKISNVSGDGTVQVLGSGYDTSDLTNNPPIVFGPDWNEVYGVWDLPTRFNKTYTPYTPGSVSLSTGQNYTFNDSTNPMSYTYYDANGR